ncbi:MAG: LysR family transcriptional regulator [Agarilytica sp.]
MNWDNIKLFLALHREGSARAVANEYSLSPSTVTRKVTELEEELETKLFNRLSSGFQLTEAGQELLVIALRMESDAYEIERKLQAKSGIMEGAIRLTVPSHIVVKPFMDSLALFSAQNGAVDLEIIPSYTAFDLSRGEADIALRVMMKDALPPEHLIGSKVVEIHVGSYASKQYLEQHDLSNPETANWVGWDDESKFPDWVASSAFPHLPVKHRFNDPYMQMYAAKSHMGLAMMPCFLCDSEEDLVRVPGTVKTHRFDLWMLSHPDLRDTLRFREFRLFLKEQFQAQHALWRGEARAETAP